MYFDLWKPSWTCKLSNEVPKMKILEFTNSVDPDEAAHNELLHLDVHGLLVFEF